MILKFKIKSSGNKKEGKNNDTKKELTIKESNALGNVNKFSLSKF